MIVGKNEDAHLTSVFTAPNADREKMDLKTALEPKKSPHAAEEKIHRFPKERNRTALKVSKSWRAKLKRKFEIYHGFYEAKRRKG